MNASSHPPNRMINGLLIVMFFGLLWTPLADSVFRFDPSPAPNEKRAPAPFPKLSMNPSAFREYLIGLEQYFNDHFGFRKTLLRWEHKWKRSWFRESSVSEVMFGQDGWLYLARGGMVDHMLGNISYSEKRLQDWRQVFQTRRDWCAARGIAYQLVIVPEKHSVYPEHLPEWIPTTRQSDPIAQLVAYLQTNSTVPVLNLREPLRHAKTNAQTYDVTDTHWNDYGAFVGYEQLLLALARQKPELQPLPLDAFEQRRSQQPGGDLAVMLGQEQTLMEPERIEFIPRTPLERIAARADATLRLAGSKSAGPSILVSENPAATGKAVLFHDSFALGLQPFLAQHFQRVVYVWQHDWDATFIEAQKPDVVIDEIAERSFYRDDPNTWKNE